MFLLIILVIGFIIGIVFSQVSKTGSVRPVITMTTIGLFLLVI